MTDAGLRFVVLFALAAGIAAADTFSLTGTLQSSDDIATFSLTLNTAGDVTLQTFGFGGGVNSAGTTISAGGFDPFVGIFSGAGADAVFLNGDSDIFPNYTPGCPPAGTLTIGSVPDQCGDVSLETDDLAPGTYTVLLSDGSYVPEADFEPSPGYLGDGFVDLTGGVFQTCYDADDCNNDTANWALDIVAPAGSALGTPDSVTPEPSTFWLTGAPLGLLALLKKASFRKTPKEIRLS